MTAQPRAPVRFRRAMERRALWMAEDPAREFPNLPLEDALAASCICTSSEVHRRLSRRRGGGSCGRHRELRRANRERILDVFVCESPVPGTETVRRASPLVFADTFAPRGPTLAPTLRLLMFNRTPGPILMLRRKRHAMPRMIAAAHEVVDLSEAD